MEQHYNNFLTTLYKLIFDFNRYCPSDNIQKILDIYKDFDMAKVIFRVYHLLNDNDEKINKHDESLFEKPFYILPDLNISISWDKLKKGQKEKIFIYLKILTIETHILINSSYQDNTKIVPYNNLEINPYIGICKNEDEYGINEMFSSLSTLETEKIDAFNIESLINMTGINKLVNIDELSNQLKNMKKDDIESATNNIKELLGNNIDHKTTSLINDMLTNITNEFKCNDMGQGDPLKNIINVAESVAEKMKPVLEDNSFDISQLINSTQIFSNQCKDKNGKSIFGDNFNVFTLLTQLTGSTQLSNNKFNLNIPKK